jgi:hypothetical protein
MLIVDSRTCRAKSSRAAFRGMGSACCPRVHSGPWTIMFLREPGPWETARCLRKLNYPVVGL